MDRKGRSKTFFFDTLGYLESPKDIQINKNIYHENWLKKNQCTKINSIFIFKQWLVRKWNFKEACFYQVYKWNTCD